MRSPPSFGPRTLASIGLGVAFAILAVTGAAAAELYRYQDANGAWQFTDKPPAEARDVERVGLSSEAAAPALVVERTNLPTGSVLRISNGYACPAEVLLAFTMTENVSNEFERRQQFVLGAGEEIDVEVPPRDPSIAWRFGLKYAYVLGDPAATHAPAEPYGAPYAATQAFRVTQGFHGNITHRDPASTYAIDIAMPVGTGIFAARGGRVVEIAYAHYAAGLDPGRDGPRANIVRMLHDDGTLGLYAHLDRASVRVRPGQRVEAGQLIAESGNTGFSTGPHLHFAVLRNAGLRLVSVPFEFRGPNGTSLTPAQGKLLTAYR